MLDQVVGCGCCNRPRKVATTTIISLHCTRKNRSMQCYFFFLLWNVTNVLMMNVNVTNCLNFFLCVFLFISSYLEEGACVRQHTALCFEPLGGPGQWIHQHQQGRSFSGGGRPGRASREWRRTARVLSCLAGHYYTTHSGDMI